MRPDGAPRPVPPAATLRVLGIAEQAAKPFWCIDLQLGLSQRLLRFPQYGLILLVVIFGADTEAFLHAALGFLDSAFDLRDGAAILAVTSATVVYHSSGHGHCSLALCALRFAVQRLTVALLLIASSLSLHYSLCRHQGALQSGWVTIHRNRRSRGNIQEPCNQKFFHGFFDLRA